MVALVHKNTYYYISRLYECRMRLERVHKADANDKITVFLDELLLKSSINFCDEVLLGEPLLDEFDVIRKLGFRKS